MLYLLYRLYGRTIIILFPLLVNLHRLLKIIEHVGRCRRGVNYLIAGIDDTLRKVRRV